MEFVGIKRNRVIGPIAVLQGRYSTGRRCDPGQLVAVDDHRRVIQPHPIGNKLHLNWNCGQWPAGDFDIARANRADHRFVRQRIEHVVCTRIKRYRIGQHSFEFEGERTTGGHVGRRKTDFLNLVDALHRQVGPSRSDIEVLDPHSTTDVVAAGGYPGPLGKSGNHRVLVAGIRGVRQPPTSGDQFDDVLQRQVALEFDLHRLIWQRTARHTHVAHFDPHAAAGVFTISLDGISTGISNAETVVVNHRYDSAAVDRGMFDMANKFPGQV